ncbi:hypothetical protein TWF696_005334 [Orbilia brochopaga]|uniref:Elongator complex protein 6 n=1 Tax=Orbilia brochopaga TaxID=3140254 RepID=A0AAV9V0H6_9PEZI
MSRLPTPNSILGPSYALLPLESQLLLVTSVLGTSPAWVIYSLLNDTFSNGGDVVLVSCLNEFTYFRDGAKRHGLDLQSHLKKDDFIFVDGLSKLFLSDAGSHGPQSIPSPPTTPSSLRGAIPTRAPISPRQQAPSIPAPGKAPSSLDPIRYITLGAAVGTSAAAIKQLDVIKAAVQAFPAKTARPRVIIEGLDIIMSATGIDVARIEDFIYELREITSTMAVLLPADPPLVHTTASSTPLEISHANLLVSLGHAADAILSLRLLDTGVAKDVSGVLRVTRGAGNLWRGAGAGAVEEKELLYHEADAGVKIFARGSGGH